MGHTRVVKYGAEGVPLVELQRTKAEAIAVGDVSYFTGAPCRYGHVVHRYVKTGRCAMCKTMENKDRIERNGPCKRDPIKLEAKRKKWNDSDGGYKARMLWRERHPEKAWAAAAIGTAKSRAKQKGVPFDIDAQYLISILAPTCPVFGTPFKLIFAGHLSAESPTLDRLIPPKGYVRGNIAVISHKANSIKQNATWQEIQQVVDWLKEI